MDQQQQQQKKANRYSHLVTNYADGTRHSGRASTELQRAEPKGVGQCVANEAVSSAIRPSGNIAGPQTNAHRRAYANSNYYNSFSNLDWREQWIMLKERVLEEASEPSKQRKLILFIVCCALLLDNMLYMVIVPIIPDYLRSIGAWSTYTENAKWIRRNSTTASGLMNSSSLVHDRTGAGLYQHTSRGHQDSRDNNKWERIGGQVVYEGEDSAVGFLFASKAIVQLFINPFSGAIIDRIGYELPMMIGLTVMFFSTMVFACGQTYTILFLARSLQGVGSAFADTSGLAMIADRFSEENERQRAIGVAIAFISFGSLVAPPFGAILYQAAGKEVPFIILSLVCLLDGSLLLLVTPPGTFAQALSGRYSTPSSLHHTSGNKLQVGSPASEAEEGAAQDDGDDDDERANKQRKAALKRQKSVSRRHSIVVASDGKAPEGTPIYVLFRDPYIACCAGALVIANVSLAFIEPTISIWMQNTMADIEEWQLGVIWLPAFFPHVFGVYLTVKLADKYPKYQWLIAAIGLVLEGVSCLMIPFCSSFWSLIIPISVICFGLALIDTAILPTLGFLVDTRYVSVYGSIYAIADISYSLSYAIGPMIAGGIAEAIGFTALNMLIAVVTLGYTPVLTMLRTIRDYQPFAADLQSGAAPPPLAASEKSPLGKFARQPVEDSELEEDRSLYESQERGAKYDLPRWANQQTSSAATSAGGGAMVLAAAAAKKSSMRQSGGFRGAANSELAGSKRQSVKIMEGNGHQRADNLSDQSKRNPFLSQ